MNTDLRINLARKWRSKSFDNVVGQDLSVRMLRNSLYFGRYFPVYLLSGQRGCGKTTLARIFAAALGCEQLEAFQKEPRGNVVPCLECVSCIAMKEGRHPDFVEIDAASHTGVDNVRQLADAAALLPVMGRKKVYLIDEAHMLSRAAFNALLKILEEPPPSALFILATTDPHKIIDTVKSRCFQLFIRPVSVDLLVPHLKRVCETEGIRYEDEGLTLVAREAQGAVRDALNTLEQVRFSSGGVSREGVLRVLGHVDDANLMTITNHVFSGDAAALLRALEDMNLEQYAPEFLWRRMIECTRAALWQQYGVKPQDFVGNDAVLSECTGSIEQLYTFLSSFYDSESLFAKTTGQHGFLKMLLLRLCQGFGPSDGSGGSSPASQSAAPQAPDDDAAEREEEDEEEDDVEEEEEIIEDNGKAQWAAFVRLAMQLDEPLLGTVFSQAQQVTHDVQSGRVAVVFPRDFALFDDAVQMGTVKWHPLLKRAFDHRAIMEASFTGQAAGNGARVAQAKRSEETTQDVSQQPPRAASQDTPVRRTGRAYPSQSAQQQPSGKRIDVSDAAHWPTTHRVLSYFPGVVTELGEEQHV